MSFIQRLAGARPEPVERQVARNLTAVLNAKKGYAEECEVFGLGDYDRHDATKPLLETLMREMLTNVARFEPRAKRPELTLLGEDGTLFAVFRLRCEIDEKPAAFRIRMNVVLRNVIVEPIAPGPPDAGGLK